MLTKQNIYLARLSPRATSFQALVKACWSEFLTLSVRFTSPSYCPGAAVQRLRQQQPPRLRQDLPHEQPHRGRGHLPRSKGAAGADTAGLDPAGLLSKPKSGAGPAPGGGACARRSRAGGLTTFLSPGRDPGLPLRPCSPVHLGGGSPGCRAELHHDRHLRGTVCDGGGRAGEGQGCEVSRRTTGGSNTGLLDP